MLPDEIKSAIRSYWNEKGLSSQISTIKSIGGGSINQAFFVQTYTNSYFLKYNDAKAHPLMFTSEFQGLNIMVQTKTIRIPKPLFAYEGAQYSCILMEYIESSEYAPDFWQKFAQDLATLHTQSSPSFGLEFSNYMGSLPQSNSQNPSFTNFFIAERLEPQIRLARNSGYLNSKHLKQAEHLYLELDAIFPQEKAALVHGDLWSGNFMSDEKGNPVIMDPATYYGHREVDIAMTTMFGGFHVDFYRYYQQCFPMERGWEERLSFYNLYPILIHINLFGSSYLRGFERILNRF
ncbi:MAG: phosphotransferase [Bacteroidales bacterium]|nr:phosphotransferase [Bacteroidales bacterium]